MQKKLEKWRSGTEDDKHFVAMVGAGLVTVAITAVWVYGTFSQLGNVSLSFNNTEIKAEAPSPVSQLGGLISNAASDVKNKTGEFIGNASVLFTSRVYERNSSPE